MAIDVRGSVLIYEVVVSELPCALWQTAAGLCKEDQANSNDVCFM